MEKSWENFWTTGKVEDYLQYRNRLSDNEERKQTAGETHMPHIDREEKKDSMS